jgi:molecular chaperone HtpG
MKIGLALQFWPAAADCRVGCREPNPGRAQHPMTTQAERESHQFQAEVVQLLDLMINSLYSNKEIFLRELISNASDAIDRLRFAAFSEPGLAPADGEKLQIRVSFDKAARTVTVSDNGIGMSRDEVIEQIGTIARSGTREFLRSLSGDQRKDAAMIGQFGVGFYSAFVVAGRVTLVTRKAGLDAGHAVRWESDGKGAYSIERSQRAGRGTDVVLHLRAGEDDLLHGYRLKSIIQKYSDHISLPIVMPADDGAAAAEGAAAESADEPVNQGSALWARSKGELSERDYQDFYKHVAGDFAAPLAYLHAAIEGTYEYTLLLFIPSRAPFDLWMPDARRGVKLHVRRVFIMEDTGQLMPVYLRFIRGVIDSADLPLNVSRELLQSSRVVDSIRSSAVKRILKLLRDLAADEPARYAAFWKEFGSVLKEGVAEDYANREEIARLLRFRSTRSAGDEADVSLDGYVGRMKDGQEKIYYLLAPTPAAAASSPLLETFRARGVEVLLFGEAVDHWVASSLQDFGGKRLASAGQEVPDFGPDGDGAADAEAAKEAAAGFAGLTSKLKDALGGKVHEVRVSSRLTTSPACIVPDEPEAGLSLMRRISGSGLPAQPVLEINPEHPLIARLNAASGDPHLGEWAEVLYSQAVLTLGAQIEDPAVFVSQLNGLLVALAGEKG